MDGRTPIEAAKEAISKDGGITLSGLLNRAHDTGKTHLVNADVIPGTSYNYDSYEYAQKEVPLMEYDIDSAALKDLLQLAITSDKPKCVATCINKFYERDDRLNAALINQILEYMDKLESSNNKEARDNVSFALLFYEKLSPEVGAMVGNIKNEYRSNKVITQAVSKSNPDHAKQIKAKHEKLHIDILNKLGEAVSDKPLGKQSDNEKALFALFQAIQQLHSDKTKDPIAKTKEITDLMVKAYNEIAERTNNSFSITGQSKNATYIAAAVEILQKEIGLIKSQQPKSGKLPLLSVSDNLDDMNKLRLDEAVYTKHKDQLSDKPKRAPLADPSPRFFQTAEKLTTDAQKQADKKRDKNDQTKEKIEDRIRGPQGGL